MSLIYLSIFTVEGAADDEPEDLAGAGADLVELAVAHDPARRVVVDVTVASEDLDAKLSFAFVNFLQGARTLFSRLC